MAGGFRAPAEHAQRTSVTERVDERSVREVGRQDAARKQDHAAHGLSFAASTSSMKASTAGWAGLMR